MKPLEVIKAKSILQKLSLPIKKPPAVIHPVFVNVRSLFQPGELEGGNRHATDPIWSLGVYKIKDVSQQKDQPSIYYLADEPKREFSLDELMLIPPDTELPPNKSIALKGYF